MSGALPVPPSYVIDGYREPESRALRNFVHAKSSEDLFPFPRLHARDAAPRGSSAFAPAFEALTQKNPEVAARSRGWRSRSVAHLATLATVSSRSGSLRPHAPGNGKAACACSAHVTVDRAPDGRLRVVTG